MEESISESGNLRELQERCEGRTENVRKACCWQNKTKVETQTEKHRQVLTTLIPFGESPACMKGGSGKENKTSWKV